MDTQKKKLIKMIIVMIKGVYQKTSQLEDIYSSQSIHIFPKNYDPLLELLDVLNITEEDAMLVSQLVGLYLENEMTADEVIIELNELVKKIA